MRSLLTLAVLAVFVATTSAQQKSPGTLTPQIESILRSIKAADKGLLAVSEEDGRFLRVMVAARNAKSILDWNGDHIMSVTKHGKGTVFALGDPWLYNEYVDGRKMNGLFQNHLAARELSAWLLTQAKKK